MTPNQGPCLERNQGGTDCVREAVVEMKGKREERERGAGEGYRGERDRDRDRYRYRYLGLKFVTYQHAIGID